MTLDANTILGFLSGSLATLIIKNIIEFINRKIEFNRELKKKFFEKKLEAADKAVASIYSMATSIGILSASYEMMSNPNKDFNYEIFRNIVANSSAQLQKLSDLSLTNINSIYLYTDIDNNPAWTHNDDKRLLDNLSDLQAQDANLLNALAAYDYSLKHDSTEQQTKIWSDIEKLVLIYKLKMNEVAGIFGESKLALLEQRKRLRDEFKRYDL